MAGSYDIRVIATYDLTIEAEDEDEAIELAERYVRAGQEFPDDVESEVLGAEEDEEDDEDEDDGDY